MAEKLISLICIVFVLGIAGSASADYIASGNITGTPSSSYNSSTWPIEGTYNEVGLDTADIHHDLGPSEWICQINGDTAASPSGATGYCWAHYAFDKIYYLDQMWVWNEGAAPNRSFKTCLVQYSTDGSNWTTLGGGTVVFTKAPQVNHSHEVELDFAYAGAKEVLIVCIDNYGDPYAGLDEVRFNLVTCKATVPNPADETEFADTDTVLSWEPGPFAVSHDVYIGTAFNDVNNASYNRLAGDVDKSGQVDWADVLILSDQWLQNPEGLEPSADLDDNNNVNFVDLSIVGNDWKKRCEGNQDVNSFDPGGLDSNTTYYWRIDEVNVAYDDSPWKGDVWSFSTCQDGAVSCYYVATDGNDNNPGTFEQPFATLEKARDTIRPLCLPDGGITVYLRGGKYFRTNTFSLAPADSGSSDKPVVYAAYPDEQPRFIGGIELDPNWFTLVTDANILNRMEAVADGNVMECNLAAHGITDYGQIRERGFYLWYYDHRYYPSHMELCFNRQIMQLARWPNSSFEHTVSADSNTTFEYSGDRPSRWTQASYPMASGYWHRGWVDRTGAIADINTVTKRITLLEEPESGLVADKPWYALNLLEEIDSAGEYYLERDNGMLYLWPPNDINSAEMFVSTFGEDKSPLVDVNNAKYITFDGLTFEISRYDGIRITDCDSILIDGCTVRNLGNGAVDISGGVNCGVQNSEIYGVDLGIGIIGGDRYTLTPCNHFARNNNIHHFGRWERCYHPGVYLLGVGGEISHNEIHHAPHFGIWYRENDHTIQFNEIHHVCQETYDTGAIYSQYGWSNRGNIIRHNSIHDIETVRQKPGALYAHAIYFDSCYSSADVFGNLIYKIPGGIGVFIGAGRDNIVENNVFVSCEVVHQCMVIDYSWLWDIEKYNYTEPPWSTAYPRLAHIMDDGEANAVKPYGNVFSRNIGWQYGLWERGFGFEYYEEIANNIEGQDPLFYDEPNMILALRDDSPAYTIPGFERIPWEQMGLLDRIKAGRPIPPNGWTNIEAGGSTLYWAPAFDANSHNMYLGTDFNDVNSGDLSVYKGTFSEPNYKGILSSGSTYYWRVDECDANGDILATGNVWSFSTPGAPNGVGWWPFDEGTGTITIDYSGYDNDGTISRAAWTDGKIGYALDFDGGDCVIIDAAALSSINQEVTIALWQYGDPDIQPQDDVIFRADDNEGRVLSIHIPWGDGNIYWDAGNDAVGDYDSIDKHCADANDYQGRWNHWAFTKNCYTGQMKIYLNGSLWHSGSGRTRAMDGITAFKIGSDIFSGTVNYDGVIDDVRVFDKELSVDDINDIYLEGL